MAFSHVITALVFALALAKVQPSECQVVKGKVTCNDCTHNYDFSGIKVSVKCEGVKKLAVATTEDNGSFKVDLPLDHNKLQHHPSSVNCHVKLVGGPNHIYASKKNQVSRIVKGKNEGINSYYTISTPISFFQFCPKHIQQHCKDSSNILDSSKTFDFPLPPEWGLAPSSFYFPFFPIIGIP